MGRKNKNKGGESSGKKDASDQQQSQNPSAASTSTAQKKEESGNKPQKGPQPPQGHQQENSPQGAWGGQQRQPGQQQQRHESSFQQTGGGQQRPGHNQQQGGGGQQQGGGRSQQQQQRGYNQQNRGDGQQQRDARQGEAGQQREQNQRTGQQQQWHESSFQQAGGGEQRPGHSQQQGGGGQQQGGWRSQQQQQRGYNQQNRGDGQQQRDARQGEAGQQREQNQRTGPQPPQGHQQENSPQGAWGGQRAAQRGFEQQRQPGQQQQRHESSFQQAGGGQQRPGHNQQQGGGGQQWGGSGPQQQQQRGYNQQNRGDGQQQRDARQGEAGQQREQNQRTGGGQQQYGRGQQQNPQQGGRSQGQQGRNQQQQQTALLRQKMEEFSMSDDTPTPVKNTSCNGIVRGTLGTPGTVEVNYVRLNLDKMPDEAYHYDVTITPDRPKKFLRAAFEQFRLEVCPDIILTFDGFKNCYAMQRLAAPMERKVEVTDTNTKMKEFLVEIKETDNCIVDLRTLRNYQNERVFDKPMRALQVLEVVLASSNHERGVRVGRSFFRRPDDPYYLEDGYEAWTGLYQAAILGEVPLLNVDIAHKSFPCESALINYLDNMKYDKNRDLGTNYDFCNFMKGLNIVYNPPTSFGAVPKQYRVLAVGEPASRKKFKTDDGKELTVANYYQSRGYTLRYPNLNCLDVGSTVRQISLPMELCSIPGGQVLNRKDQSRQVERMVRYAATSTNKRKQKIMELLRYFDHNVNPIIRAFGLAIGSNFIKVPMRMLPSPYMEYLQGKTVTTFKGAWRMDGMKFLICSQPPNDHKWAILYEDRARISHHELEGFKSAVIKTSKNLNMNLQNSADIQSYNFRQLESLLKKFATDRYDLVFVVLSDRGTPYAKIKQIAELEVGILTQCIKDKTIFRTARDLTVFSNILLKVNGKLNGTNHKIAQDRNSNLLSSVKKVMYLGADVTHPSPDQRHIPSVVGVAASHDLYGACYNCQYRLQRSTVENIEDMESIFCRHLEVYRKYQNSYPEQIIYYRDGVSDGQFPIVEREEIRAIKRACKKMGCNPKMTCVIVVKRHHTRFFPLKAPQNERDFNNVQAGTVVDQFITHPNEVQFFMVSHQSIQGTARPTRYNVIMDESKFDVNLLQKLTYNLCHLFPRCNRAVSYPAPAYLAHLVAFRGRVYLEGTHKFGNLNREYEKRQIKPDFMNKNPMYFI